METAIRDDILDMIQDHVFASHGERALETVTTGVPLPPLDCKVCDSLFALLGEPAR